MLDSSWKVAAARAVVTAVIVGALGALAMWAVSDSIKEVAIAGLTPMFTVLAIRLGAEGYVDRPK